MVGCECLVYKNTYVPLYPYLSGEKYPPCVYVAQKHIPIKEDRQQLPWSGGVIQNDADSAISKFKIKRYVRKRHVYIRLFTPTYAYLRQFTPT